MTDTQMIRGPAVHSFIHYEHFSAQVNIHRKCANVTVIYQIKSVKQFSERVFAQRRILQTGRQIVPDCGTRDRTLSKPVEWIG